MLICPVSSDDSVVDAAAQDQDPLRRIAFVAAFAMSNYSSTIGRYFFSPPQRAYLRPLYSIAKPFNPMLSETFEYVRFDKEFRYMSEQVRITGALLILPHVEISIQVSHHPPISACYAESPRWHYYGEVDAQNKCELISMIFFRTF